MKPGVVFSNLPAPIERAVYQEAVARYVASVGDRTRAIYQVGNVSYPGLSDIDLVVVVSRAAWDNNQYFSPFLRLPHPYRSLFHHEPRFIPESCMDAIEFGSCVHASGPHASNGSAQSFGSHRRLIFGADALGARAVDVASQSWQRCRILEVTFLFQRALQEISSGPVVDVVKLMSRATVLRYPMRHLHDLLGISRDAQYERRVDDCRNILLRTDVSDEDKQRTAAGALLMLDTATRRFESKVRTLFGLSSSEDVVTAAAAMLSGARPALGIEKTYLTARLSIMRRYHDEQRRYQLTGGSIFATKPYNGTIKPYSQPLAHRVASSARWRWSYAKSS